MTTGTGIFFAGLIIGLVMLYGQTKDRWNWKKIAYFFLFVIVFIAITIYHALNDWKAFEIDWSVKGFTVGLLTYIAVLVITVLPIYIASEFYEKVLDKNIENDEEGNDRLIYKIFTWISYILFLVVVFFFADSLKEKIRTWIFG